MKLKKTSLKQKLILVLLSTFTFNQAMAKPNAKVVEGDQAQQHEGHSKHLAEDQKYHGVFFGYLPCKDCDGTRTTLSLKNRNNYLLVTQVVKQSAREYFEKGKYTWDEETQIVTLTSRKNSVIKKYRIRDEKTLVQLSSKGSTLKTNQKNTSYVLHKNEMLKQTTSSSRHMH